MRFQTLTLALAAGVALAACSNNGDSDPGGDTIAVPAAAVDTTPPAMDSGATVEVGTPGAGTTESGRSVAEGVDTPITRKLNAKQQAEQQNKP